ncbi:hypothetical protein HHI36_017657 [Cryptolaemus montrouzieri]|uniref:Peroxisomal membrane protein 11C n=1 Tax=Cryptolaemus montrouzieri TaxID=559131 RepID=A0ABD2NNV8_9CUCU
MVCSYIVNEICTMLDTYKGRDKILRTLCYSTKLVGGLTKNEDLAKKLLYVSKHLSETRTTLRLLDDLPMLKYSFEYGLGKEEDNCLMASVGVVTNIIDQVYYPLEKVAWLAEHKLISGIDTNKWDTASSICWVTSIYLSLIKTLRCLVHLRKHIEKIKNQNQRGTNASLEKLLIRQQFELITCIRLSLDFVHAVNYLPKGYLWSSQLKTWHIEICNKCTNITHLETGRIQISHYYLKASYCKLENSSLFRRSIEVYAKHASNLVVLCGYMLKRLSKVSTVYVATIYPQIIKKDNNPTVEQGLHDT